MEEADCSEEDQGPSPKSIREFMWWKQSIFCLAWRRSVSSDVTKEFYLTDIVSNNEKFEALAFDNGERFAGVNTLRSIGIGRKILCEGRKFINFREEGVRFLDSRHVYIEDPVDYRSGMSGFSPCDI